MVKSGWRGQSARHSLAARGCRSSPQKSMKYIKYEKEGPRYRVHKKGESWPYDCGCEMECEGNGKWMVLTFCEEHDPSVIREDDEDYDPEKDQGEDY